MRKILFAFSLGFVPYSAYGDECDFAFEVEEVALEEDVAADESNNELKDLIGAMKSDRAVNKERVKRVKQLIKEKGWNKKSLSCEEQNSCDLS